MYDRMAVLKKELDELEETYAAETSEEQRAYR
jgi:hypothetical protein